MKTTRKQAAAQKQTMDEYEDELIVLEEKAERSQRALRKFLAA